jgi:hypothetical protein
MSRRVVAPAPQQAPRAVLTSGESCTFLTSKWNKKKKGRCCSESWCSAFQKYDVQTIMALRLHLGSKTKEEKKTYFQARRDVFVTEALFG